MNWTPEQDELARTLWRVDGWSASQIAKKLGGGLSRSAVLGRLYRMGLTGDPPKGRKAASPPKQMPSAPQARRPIPLPRIGGPTQANPQALKLAAAVANAEARLAAPVGPTEPRGSATILTLTPRMCRWPIGSPSDDDFTFCGCDAPEGPYCTTTLDANGRSHRDRAHQPSTPNKRAVEPLQARVTARFA